MAKKAKESLDRYHGIVPPLVTPLKTPGELDPAGLRRLIRHVVGNGVHGVFILGTTGEFPSLTQKMKRKIIDITVEEVDGKIPVYVGIFPCLRSATFSRVPWSLRCWARSWWCCWGDDPAPAVRSRRGFCTP